jgi:hypothetical protein
LRSFPFFTVIVFFGALIAAIAIVIVIVVMKWNGMPFLPFGYVEQCVMAS